MQATLVSFALAAVVAACARPAPTPEPVSKKLTVGERIARYNAQQLSRYGMTTAQRLRLYIRLFNQRPDVHVVDHRIGGPMIPFWRKRLAAELPDHVLAFHAEMDGVEWTWSFEPNPAVRKASSKGYNGGRLNLQGAHTFRWWARRRFDPKGFAQYMVWDDVVAEGTTLLITGKQFDYRAATLAFVSASDPLDLTDIGDVEFYISEGARLGFAWYWQAGGHGEAGDVATKLYDNSLPRDTPRYKVRAELIRHGATEKEAEVLIEWLGEHVVVLLPK